MAPVLELALRRRAMTVMVAAAVAGLGVWSALQLKVEAYPDLSETQVVVVTLYPGHAAEEIERQVTIPIERALTSVPQVMARRSRTIFGLSVVDLTFDSEVADAAARAAVLEKLREAELPAGLEPSLAPPTTPAGELYRYTVEGAGGDGMALRELQDWVIAPRLLQVPGVGDVFAFGGLVKQYQVAVDPLALYKYGLTIDGIAKSVDDNNRNAGGALITSGEQALVVRGVGALRSVADLEKIVVASSGGTPVYLRDVGKIGLGAAPQSGIFGIDSRTGGVEGVVAMRRGENPSAVLAGVRAAVEELNGGGLPAGVRLEPVYDRTELVGNTLRTVLKTTAEGLAIVIVVLLFFLGSVEAALLTALTIPLALLFAFTVMHFAGIPASLLSLGAMDFGIIVDGTVVMVELIVRRMKAQREAGSHVGSVESVRESARLIWRPLLFSLLILVAAYIPMFTLERAERRLFTPMAFTLSAALVGAMLCALTVVPVLATWLFRHGYRSWANPLIPLIRRGYERSLAVVVGHRWKMVGVTTVGLALCYGLAARTGSEFLPHLDEGVIWIRATLPAGISLEESAKAGTRIRGLIAESPEVTVVTSQTGRQDSNTEPFGPNRNEFLVGLKPYGEWRAGMTKERLVEELAGRLRAAAPGVAFNFTQPIIDMVTEALTGSSADLAVILSGPELGELRARAREVLAIVSGIEGAADAAIEQEPEQAQVRIEVDREEVARHGLNVSDVQDAIELAIGGRGVSTIYEGERAFDVVVRYQAEARSTVEGIGQMLVRAPDGTRVAMGRLAKIEVRDGASIISRREMRRQVSVRANIRGRDQGSFVAEAQARLRRELKLKPGYRIEWGGQFENLDRARKRLAWILPLTLAVIFGLLYWAFNSLLDAGLVLAGIPFSAAGGVVALLARDIHLSVSAAVGFVSLFGVSVMSGVLLLAEVNRRMAAGVSVETAVKAGAATQFWPRLVLIGIAMLGIVPAALQQGIGSDIQRPMATVIFGGLVSTLLLTLYGSPVLCVLFKRRAGGSTGH